MNEKTKIPLVIKMAWSVLFIWMAFYLITYALPDLMEWIQKTNPSP